MPGLVVAHTVLHYEASGHGPLTICLVHGAGGSVAAWRPQLDGLADVARVVALDLPGHGRSAGDGIGSIDAGAALVLGAMDALGVDRVVVGGHSMGGAIAQTVALTAPGRTAGLVLVGTGARLRVLPELFTRIERDHADAVRFIVGLALGAGASDTLRARLVDETLRTPAATLAGDFSACDRFDVAARLGDIAAPTLVVCGDADRMTPPKYAELLGARIAGARVVVVPGAGHYVQLEQPDAVTAAIREFVTKPGGPA